MKNIFIIILTLRLLVLIANAQDSNTKIADNSENLTGMYGTSKLYTFNPSVKSDDKCIFAQRCSVKQPQATNSLTTQFATASPASYFTSVPKYAPIPIAKCKWLLFSHFMNNPDPTIVNISSLDTNNKFEYRIVIPTNFSSSEAANYLASYMKNRFYQIGTFGTIGDYCYASPIILIEVNNSMVANKIFSVPMPKLSAIKERTMEVKAQSDSAGSNGLHVVSKTLKVNPNEIYDDYIFDIVSAKPTPPSIGKPGYYDATKWKYSLSLLQDAFGNSNGINVVCSANKKDNISDPEIWIDVKAGVKYRTIKHSLYY